MNLVFKVFGFGMNFLCGLVIRNLDVPLVGSAGINGERINGL